jgi:hypothetical protein
MAARQLRSLSRGNAFISYVGIDGWKGARVTVPPVQEAKVPADGTERVRSAILNVSPSALPAGDAQAALDKREQALFAVASMLNAPSVETKAIPAKVNMLKIAAPEPENWRVAAPKRKPKPGHRPQ